MQTPAMNRSHERAMCLLDEVNRGQTETVQHHYKWTHHHPQAERALAGDYYSLLPPTVEMMPSLLCPFACPHCAFRYGKEVCGLWGQPSQPTPEVLMTWEEAVLILHRLAEADVRGIVWTGGGEPTRWPYLLQGLQLADQLGMDSILYTNGRLFRAADLPHLATLPRLRLIRISLSAGTPVIHAQFHGYDGSRTRHFDRVVQNIEGLACAIVQRGDGGGPQMGIGVIINEVNVDDLINTARLLRTIHERCGGGIAFLHVRPVVNYHYPDRPQIDAGVIDRAVAQRPLIESILAEAGIRLNFLDHRFEEIQQGSGLKPFDECRGAGWVAEIGPRGKVYFCCETALLPEWEIGDLTRQTLPEIWAGETRWRIIERLRQTRCAGCPVTCLPRTLNTMMQAVENARQRGGTSRTNFLRKVRLQQDRPPCRLINFVQ